MTVPDKHINSAGTKGLESKEGERGCLSGDSTGTRSSSLEFNTNQEFVSGDDAIDYLTQILVEMYLEEYANKKAQGGNLLSRGDSWAESECAR